MGHQVQWHLSGDYFENCSCSVVCPCLVSKSLPPLTSDCRGRMQRATDLPYRTAASMATSRSMASTWCSAVHTPGPMADGNWSVAADIDEHADDKETEGLGAIFTGAAGGPMAALAPLIVSILGQEGPHHLPN